MLFYLVILQIKVNQEQYYKLIKFDMIDLELVYMGNAVGSGVECH